MLALVKRELEISRNPLVASGSSSMSIQFENSLEVINPEKLSIILAEQLKYGAFREAELTRLGGCMYNSEEIVQERYSKWLPATSSNLIRLLSWFRGTYANVEYKQVGVSNVKNMGDTQWARDVFQELQRGVIFQDQSRYKLLRVFPDLPHSDAIVPKIVVLVMDSHTSERYVIKLSQDLLTMEIVSILWKF